MESKQSWVENVEELAALCKTSTPKELDGVVKHTIRLLNAPFPGSERKR
jgi:hypothetical protein